MLVCLCGNVDVCLGVCGGMFTCVDVNVCLGVCECVFACVWVCMCVCVCVWKCGRAWGMYRLLAAICSGLHNMHIVYLCRVPLRGRSSSSGISSVGSRYI